MESAAANWRYDNIHEARPFHDGTFPEDPSDWSAVRSEETPYSYRDGVNVWVSQQDLSPEDRFLDFDASE